MFYDYNILQMLENQCVSILLYEYIDGIIFYLEGLHFDM
jgi:hypothetical protein